METKINTIPGYRVKEYLLVLSPHEELRHRILKVKEEFAATYKMEKGQWGIPQVAMVSFKQLAMLEERIISRLQTIAMGFPPFKVELKDYGSFPSHTIYIKVTSKLPVQHLVKKIRKESQRIMKLNKDNKPHFMMESHITIGRKLKPWQYEKGWLEYRHKHFTGRFIADGMTLLGRQEGTVKYHLVQQFTFQNLPVSTKQGELFG
jgi:2'-5' RNA ligase